MAEFDAVALKAKYLEERDIRLRADGNEQVGINLVFSRFTVAFGGLWTSKRDYFLPEGQSVKPREHSFDASVHSQYINISEYKELLEDPYTEKISREPLHDEIDVIIVGGGFGAQLSAVRLQEVGISGSRVRLIEKGGDFGGTVGFLGRVWPVMGSDAFFCL
jgi:hypothetical protein